MWKPCHLLLFFLAVVVVVVGQQGEAVDESIDDDEEFVEAREDIDLRSFRNSSGRFTRLKKIKDLIRNNGPRISKFRLLWRRCDQKASISFQTGNTNPEPKIIQASTRNVEYPFKTCWKVTTKSGLLRFTFRELNFEYCNANCLKCHHLSIYEIDQNDTARRIHQRQCTRSAPPYSFPTARQTALIIFYLEPSFRIGQRNFTLLVHTEKTSEGVLLNSEDSKPCNDSVTFIDSDKKSGTIQSYIRANGTFRPSEQCTWRIVVPENDTNKIVRFTFRRIRMAGSCSLGDYDCVNVCKTTSDDDYVAIWDSNAENGTLLARMCGMGSPMIRFRTVSNKATVIFKTSAKSPSPGFDGFILDFDIVSGDAFSCQPPDTSTQGLYFDGEPQLFIPPYSHASLSSYGRQDGRYRRFEYCPKLLLTDAGFVFKISVISLELAARDDRIRLSYKKVINAEFVTAEDGIDSNNQIKTLIIPQNNATLTFITLDVAQRRGFNLAIESVLGKDYLSDCESEPDSSTSTIENYKRRDGKYRMQENCTWLIEASQPAAVIRLTFTEFDVDGKSDWVAIYDGSTVFSPELVKLNNTIYFNIESNTFHTSGRSALVHFYARNDDDHNGTGFKLSYEVVNNEADEQPFQTTSTVLITVGILGSLFILSQVVAIGLFVRWYKQKLLLEKKRQELLNSLLKDTYSVGGQSFHSLLEEYGCSKLASLVDRLDIPTNRLSLLAGERESEVGQGNFSKVTKALLSVSSPNDQPRQQEVALKRLKPTDQRCDDIKQVLREAFIMQSLQHQNVLELIGMVVLNQTPNLVFPFMSNGNLRDFLRNGTFTQHAAEINSGEELWKEQQMHKFCVEICSGMAYLHSKNFIHCDLACRNVLVDADMTLKISDFGLAKDLEPIRSYQFFSETSLECEEDCPLAVRWAPPELFVHPRIVTTKSDVWSYGVVCWEIYSFCVSEPYADLSITKVVEYVCAGNRLKQPELCPEEMYEKVMLLCWRAYRNDRPEFTEIAKCLATIKLR